MADFSPADVAEVTVTVVHKVKKKLGTTEYDVPIGVDEVQEQNDQEDEVKIVVHLLNFCKKKLYTLFRKKRFVFDEKFQ